MRSMGSPGKRYIIEGNNRRYTLQLIPRLKLELVRRPRSSTRHRSERARLSDVTASSVNLSILTTTFELEMDASCRMAFTFIMV